MVLRFRKGWGTRLHSSIALPYAMYMYLGEVGYSSDDPDKTEAGFIRLFASWRSGIGRNNLWGEGGGGGGGEGRGGEGRGGEGR